MVTTFFGPQSFGGDATYVDHLSRGLVRAGHQVEVVHCADSYRLVSGDAPLRPWQPPPDGLKVHTLSSPVGALAPLLTHQTGFPAANARALQRILGEGSFDVVHFHNISLLGGLAGLRLASGPDRPVSLMSLHDYWLVCPMHLLWKLGRSVCDRPQCLRCTVHGRRPPQVWRQTGLRDRALEGLDHLLAPSRYAVELHRRRGIRKPIEKLCYHLPSDWAAEGEAEPEPAGAAAASPGRGRPYFTAAGRMIDEKGFDRLIEAMIEVPQYDLLLAGAGPREASLREQAAGADNVRLIGWRSHSQLSELYRGARAVIVPSRFPETFGYVAVEAMSTGTPVIVSDSGALPELIEASGAGIVFRSDAELTGAIRRLGEDAAYSAELGRRGAESAASVWSERTHLERYMGLVDDSLRRRAANSS